MPRVTQAGKVEQENEQALAFFEQTLAALPDPRRSQGVRYPLKPVVVIALMATICGCDDAESMQLWGEANATWLGGFLDLPHDSPTQDVFLAVFAALDPKAFGAVLRSWAALLALRLRSNRRAHRGQDPPPARASRRRCGRRRARRARLRPGRGRASCRCRLPSPRREPPRRAAAARSSNTSA